MTSAIYTPPEKRTYPVFAAALGRHMAQRGLKQIDLVRLLAEQPQGHAHRQLVNLWVHGIARPGPAYLTALADVFGLDYLQAVAFYEAAGHPLASGLLAYKTPSYMARQQPPAKHEHIAVVLVSLMREAPVKPWKLIQRLAKGGLHVPKGMLRQYMAGEALPEPAVLDAIGTILQVDYAIPGATKLLCDAASLGAPPSFPLESC